MKRYLVQDWYLDERGDAVLQSEKLFRTEKDAFLFGIKLSRRLNGLHSIDIVELRPVVSTFRRGLSKEVK